MLYHRRGVPFRDTHHMSGQAVSLAEQRGVSLTDLTKDDLLPINDKFEDDVTQVWDF